MPGCTAGRSSRSTDSSRSIWLHGVRLAERLFGNAQAMNTMLLGHRLAARAWCRVGEAAILRAIELNGAAVALNKRAFLWGRILATGPGWPSRSWRGRPKARRTIWMRLIARRTGGVDRLPGQAASAALPRLVDAVAARETAVIGHGRTR